MALLTKFRIKRIIRLKNNKDVKNLIQIAFSTKDNEAFYAAVTAVNDLDDKGIPDLVGPQIHILQNDLRALEILYQLKDPKSVDYLIEALSIDIPVVREVAIRYLGLKKDRRAISPLLEMYQYPNFEMETVIALSRFEDDYLRISKSWCPKCHKNTYKIWDNRIRTVRGGRFGMDIISNGYYCYKCDSCGYSNTYYYTRKN